MTNMTQKQLSNQIQQYCFALKELELYLDTHPNCKKALELFHNYSDKKEKAVKLYNENYGALQSTQVSENKWNWVDDPWPWEKGGNS